MTYERSIDRIGVRPGAGIQTWITRRLVSKFLGDDTDLFVLEVGSGIGRIAEEVTRRGHKYVGVEPTASLRFAAEQRLSSLGISGSIIDDSLPNLSSIKENAFTHAMALHVLEHAESSESALTWLESIAKRVKRGGKVLIVCPNYRDLKQAFFDVDWTHQWVSTTSRIAMLGEEIGLTILEETDLRGTFKHIVPRATLAVCSALFPTQLINWFFRRFFGLRNLGFGVQSALLWRMSWVVFEKT